MARVPPISKVTSGPPGVPLISNTSGLPGTCHMISERCYVHC